MDIHAPIIEKDVTIRRKRPWFNDSIKHHKRKVQSLERWFKYKRTYSAWLEFDWTRKGYREVLTNAKIACYSDQVKSSKGDTKKLYNLVYGLMGDVKCNPLLEHTDDAKLAKEFPDFFIAKIQAIRDDLEHHAKFQPTIRSTESFTELRLYNEDKIWDKIFNMNKSCDLLRKCIDHLLPVLTKLVNVSLWSGVFSQKWKVAIVKPLLKKLGMELISASYRPISNLKFVSKLVESCAMDRLNKHCYYNRLKPDYQSAYRRFYSCEMSVLKLVNDILWGMECQEISSMIACDLSAAFDTVDHLLLLDILSNKFGVGGTALNCFDSYLHPRSLQVMIGKEFLSERDLPFSVPQGSCAVAQLFNLYCSTVHEVVISPDENENPLSLYGFTNDHTVHDQFKANDRSADLNQSQNYRNVHRI